MTVESKILLHLKTLACLSYLSVFCKLWGLEEALFFFFQIEMLCILLKIHVLLKILEVAVLEDM